MKGVLVVDIQGDFTQLMSGPLAVAGTGLDYLNKISRAMDRIKEVGIPVWASQDWHPAEHISFNTNHPGKNAFEVITVKGKEQVLWPPHCVQETSGADLLIDASLFEAVVQKGKDHRFDSYSCFQDDGGEETKLHQWLRRRGIKTLALFGIATDYCVRYSALDGLARGYNLVVIKTLCRGVDPETSARALREIQGKGVMIFEDLERFFEI